MWYSSKSISVRANTTRKGSELKNKGLLTDLGSRYRFGRTLNKDQAALPKPQPPAIDSTAATDVFICHASEDKAAVARPLATELRQRGLTVWYDEYILTLGDSLPREIDRGLASCRFGVVILSPDFFAKNWPQRELDGLAAREVRGGEKVILPVWHNVTAGDVEQYSPTLAAKLAVPTAKGISVVVNEIVKALTHPREETTSEVAAPGSTPPHAWLGAEWNGRFLAYDGPFESLPLIEDAVFEQSMADALQRDERFAVYMGRPDKLSYHAEQGYRVLYLTDRSSWRRKITKGDVLLLAKLTS